MIWQWNQLDTAAGLPLSEQFETVYNQATHEDLAEIFKYPEQIAPFRERTQTEITPEMYPSLNKF